MKTSFSNFLIALALLACINQAAAQGSRFFRISGPAATAITAFGQDGTIIWSNALAGTNYTVQTVSSLSGGTNWVDYVQLPVTKSVNTNQIIAFNPPTGMAFIPAGVFTIGNSIGDSDIPDANPTNVYVSAFYMDVNLVSSNQWAAVYNYATNHGYSIVYFGSEEKLANNPVDSVGWSECVKWSNARSVQAGLTPVYYTDAGLTQVYTNGDPVTVYPNWAANGYRLPTEAEWEKAARGGLSGQRFPWGNTISESQANYSASPYIINYGGSTVTNSAGHTYDLGPYNGFNTNFDIGGYPYTSPVGYFAPNGYGLNDMAGNVQEWCWDWYAGPPYPAGSPYLGGTDPRGSATDDEYGDGRVLRGGDWNDTADNGYGGFESERCAFRATDGADYTVGFRCVRGH